jgi:hypothetical protein
VLLLGGGMSRSVQRSPVKSSSLASVGFSPEHNVLQVEFRNGLVYEYFGVTQGLYEQLLAADSIGAFLNHFVRNRYPFRRLDNGQKEELTQ